MTNWRRMTEAELIEWGAAEDERRSVEIEAVTSADDLQRVQYDTRVRRAAIGLNATQATRWVKAGRRSRMGLPSL